MKDKKQKKKERNRRTDGRTDGTNDRVMCEDGRDHPSINLSWLMDLGWRWPGFSHLRVLVFFFHFLMKKKGENENVSSHKRPTETKQEILSIQRQLSNRFKKSVKWKTPRSIATRYISLHFHSAVCCVVQYKANPRRRSRKKRKKKSPRWRH